MHNTDTNETEELVLYHHNGKWLGWAEIRPSSIHGRGVFAKRRHRAGDPVLPYFGSLVRHEARSIVDGTAMMKMQSGLRQYVVVGSSDSPSGAVYVNDKRGSRHAANVKISVGVNVNRPISEYEPAQFMLLCDHEEGEGPPQAVGKVIPMYVATKAIKPGEELLARYGWTEREWRAVL